MMLGKKDISYAIKGASILSTGGGGDYKEALGMVKDIESIELVNKADSYFATVFSMGRLSEKVTKINFESLARENLELYRILFKKDIRGLYPVEIGPSQVALTFKLAKLLGFPIFDGDVCGGRSVPAIGLDLSAYRDIDNEPFIFNTLRNNLYVLKNTEGFEEIEELAKFILPKEKKLLGIGFVNKEKLKNLAVGSVSFAISVARDLEKSDELKGFEFLGEFKIEKIVKTNHPRFLVADVYLGDYKIKVVNENMVLYRGEREIISYPDYILLLDPEEKYGISNRNLKEGMRVLLYVGENPFYADIRDKAKEKLKNFLTNL